MAYLVEAQDSDKPVSQKEIFSDLRPEDASVQEISSFGEVLTASALGVKGMNLADKTRVETFFRLRRESIDASNAIPSAYSEATAEERQAARIKSAVARERLDKFARKNWHVREARQLENWTSSTANSLDENLAQLIRAKGGTRFLLLGTGAILIMDAAYRLYLVQNKKQPGLFPLGRKLREEVLPDTVHDFSEEELKR